MLYIVKYSMYVVCLVLCHVHVYSLCVYGYMYCAVSDYLPIGRYIHALQCRGFRRSILSPFHSHVV